jgi:hypothetical protein
MPAGRWKLRWRPTYSNTRHLVLWRPLPPVTSLPTRSLERETFFIAACASRAFCVGHARHCAGVLRELWCGDGQGHDPRPQARHQARGGPVHPRPGAIRTCVCRVFSHHLLTQSVADECFCWAHHRSSGPGSSSSSRTATTPQWKRGARYGALTLTLTQWLSRERVGAACVCLISTRAAVGGIALGSAPKAVSHARH